MRDSALQAHLISLGASAAHVADLETNDLIGLAGDLQLARGLDLDIEVLAARSDTSVDRVRSIYASLGLDVDDLAGFGAGDVEFVSLAAADDSGLVEQVSEPLFRVAGSSLRRIAETAVAAYVQDIENHPDQLDTSNVSLADLNHLGSGLVVHFGQLFGTLFRHHMWTAVRRQRSGQQGVAEPELIRMGVGFVDLVGFTPISRTLASSELLRVIEEFEQRAFEIATLHGGRVVKSIGDEVMIAAPNHGLVAAIALDLVREFDHHQSIQPRAGLSSGDVLFRLGDYYGSVVNLASRLVDVAAPGQVLTDLGVSEAGGVGLVPLGNRDLKGFDVPVAVWSVESISENGVQ